MGRTASKQAAALARARERRIAMDQQRDARDARVEQGAATVMLLLEQRAEAEQSVVAANEAIGVELNKLLLEDGMDLEHAAVLCDLEAAKVRRLSRLGASVQSV